MNLTDLDRISERHVEHQLRDRQRRAAHRQRRRTVHLKSWGCIIANTMAPGTDVTALLAALRRS